MQIHSLKVISSVNVKKQKLYKGFVSLVSFSKIKMKSTKLADNSANSNETLNNILHDCHCVCSPVYTLTQRDVRLCYFHAFAIQLGCNLFCKFANSILLPLYLLKWSWNGRSCACVHAVVKRRREITVPTLNILFFMIAICLKQQNKQQQRTMPPRKMSSNGLHMFSFGECAFCAHSHLSQAHSLNCVHAYEII